MHVWVAVLAVLLVAVAFLPESLATGHAAQPSLERNTLWAHVDPVADRFDHHMSTDSNQSDAEDPGTANAGDAWTWTLTLKPALNRTLILDSNETIHVAVYLGGDTHLGDVQVSTALHRGENVIAQADPQDHTFTPSGLGLIGMGDDEPYPLLEWDAAVELDRVAPGDELVWTVTARGSFTGIFMGMSEPRGHSHMELPIIAVETPSPQETEDELVTPAPGALFVGLVVLSIVLARRTHQRKTP